MEALAALALAICLLGTGFGSPGEAWQVAGDIALPEGTRLALQINDHLSTKVNHEGDSFTANVIVPVYQGDRLVIPKGSTVAGSISRVVRPGRFRGKALMNLIFDSIHIPGRGDLPLAASLVRVDLEGNEGIQDEGTVRGEGSVGKDVGRIVVPGATGAGIGGISGGGRGAAVGGGVGALVGLATVFSTRGKDLEMRRGATLEISLNRPLAVPLETGARSGRIR